MGVNEVEVTLLEVLFLLICLQGRAVAQADEPRPKLLEAFLGENVVDFNANLELGLPRDALELV